MQINLYLDNRSWWESLVCRRSAPSPTVATLRTPAPLGLSILVSWPNSSFVNRFHSILTHVVTGEVHSAVEKYLPVEHHLPSPTPSSPTASPTTSVPKKNLLCPLKCAINFHTEQQLTDHFRIQHGFSQVCVLKIFSVNIFNVLIFRRLCRKWRKETLPWRQKTPEIGDLSNITSVLLRITTSTSLFLFVLCLLSFLVPLSKLYIIDTSSYEIHSLHLKRLFCIFKLIFLGKKLSDWFKHVWLSREQRFRWTGADRE